MKTSPISFSVLIPNYNHAAYLPQCLDSILSQSRQPEAIHIVDDASTDRSVEIIRSYVQRFPHVHLIAKTKNCGQNANVNEYISRIEGTHVLILAADDYLLPDAIEPAHAMLSEHPDAGLCLTDTVDVFPDGLQRRFSYGISTKAAYFSPEKAPFAIRGRGLVPQCFLHREGLRKIGGYLPGLRWHADHFACAVLAARHGFCYVPQVCAASRKLPASYSTHGMHGPEQQKVLAAFLDYMCRPEFADVKTALRDSHVLAIFEDGLFSALRRDPGHRFFLTPSLMSWLLWRRVRYHFRHPVPQAVKRWFRRS